MDRNTIIALALAMLVLSLYQSVFVVPKRVQESKTSQVVQSNKVISNETAHSATPLVSLDKTTSVDSKAELSDLKTTALELYFSNVGGTLHNFKFSSSPEIIPVLNILGTQGIDESAYSVTDKTADSITYTYADSQKKIVKTFKINDPHSLKANIQITNLSDSRLENNKITTFDIDCSNIDLRNNRSTMLDELSILENNKVIRKGNAYKFNQKDNKSGSGSIEWTGYRTHYHAFLVKPEFGTKGYENEVLGENKLRVNVTPEKQVIMPHETINYGFTIIVGNQDISWLKSYNMKLEKIVAFSNFWVIDILAKGVYYAVPVLHTICRSWGLSIILISLIIYGLTYPLTMKSMASMRKMQMVQPKVASLQKRYKDDPQALNKEMMELYRREGVNPLGGCLPFLLQMPIFMALYQILWRAYYFQGQSFLWIKDLTLPDRLFILPFDLPFLGNQFNILPILMGVVMFLQQSISSKNMIVTDEQQAMQQKMMRYIFPFFIGFIFYKFASGLSLYFSVFYALSAWTQWKVSKMGTAPQAK